MVAVRAFAGVVAFLALLQVLPIGASLVHVPMSQGLAIAMVLVAVAGAFWFGRRFPKAPPAPPHIPQGAGERLAHRSFTALAGLVLMWLVVVWGLDWALAWYRTPGGWDELWYHIPAVNGWVLRGGVGFAPLDPVLAGLPLEVQLAGWQNFPMGIELTAFMLYHVTGGSDRLIDAANLPWWPLAATALAVIAGRLGARGIWAWLAGGLLVGVSLYVMQGATLYVDAGFASATMAAIAAALVYTLGTVPAGSAIILLGAAVGLMLGAKGVGAPFTVVILGVTLVAVLLQQGWRRWRPVVLRLGLAGLIAVAVGGYWYLRNAVHTGNPIYPIQLQLGHKVLVPGYDLTGYDRLDWVVRPVLKPYPAWARTYVAWLQRDLPILAPEQRGNYAVAGGLGFIWLVGGLPAAIWLLVRAVRRPRTEEAAALLLLTGLLLCLYLTTPIPWQARFTFWLHALGLPAVAVLLAEAVKEWRRRPAALAALVAGWGAVGVAVWESQATLRSEWQVGRDPGSPTAQFRPTVERYWPGILKTPGFEDLFTAPRLARGPWLSADATTATGMLAQPLGREVQVLPADPDSARLRRLGVEGIEWVLWEAPKEAALPAALLGQAAEVHRYQRVGDFDFYAVRLAHGADDTPEVTLHGMDRR